jgi:DnaJ-class molecular chaperone
VLGLSCRATNDQIKAARRTMGLLYHPDKAVARGMDEAAATEKMREINRAYDVLSDGKNREWYDRTGYLPGKAS